MGSRIEGRAQTRWERTRDIDGSQLEGEELGQNYPKLAVHFSFTTREGVC